MESPPFQVEHELISLDYNSLFCHGRQECDSQTQNRESITDQKSALGCINSLPGHPRVPLNDGPTLSNFLLDELYASDLEAMAPHLWIMSTQCHSNINPLHGQKIHGRNIVISEDPRLHLCWIYDRIFVKPLPQYLLSHSFWEQFLSSEGSPLGFQRLTVRKAATGFLRTYYYLIRHESDFHIANDEKLRLIPPHITWFQFCNFINAFACISDDGVSQGFHYGELRLSRLNFYAKILLRKFQCVQLNRLYGAYYTYFYGPLLFVFATVSCALNAMQVWLQVQGQMALQGFFFCVVPEVQHGHHDLSGLSFVIYGHTAGLDDHG